MQVVYRKMRSVNCNRNSAGWPKWWCVIGSKSSPWGVCTKSWRRKPRHLSGPSVVLFCGLRHLYQTGFFLSGVERRTGEEGRLLMMSTEDVTTTIHLTPIGVLWSDSLSNYGTLALIQNLLSYPAVYSLHKQQHLNWNGTSYDSFETLTHDSKKHLAKQMTILK